MNASEDSKDLETRLFEERVRVFSNPDQAILLAKKSGFPAERLPIFSTSLVFWTKVAEEAKNGAIEDGFQSIIEHAAIQYPNNQIFSQSHQKNSSEPEPRKKPSSQKTETITGSPELIGLIRNLIAGAQPQFAKQLSQQDIPHQRTSISSLFAEAVREKIQAEANAIKRRTEERDCDFSSYSLKIKRRTRERLECAVDAEMTDGRVLRTPRDLTKRCRSSWNCFRPTETRNERPVAPSPPRTQTRLSPSRAS